MVIFRKYYDESNLTYWSLQIFTDLWILTLIQHLHGFWERKSNTLMRLNVLFLRILFHYVLIRSYFLQNTSCTWYQKVLLTLIIISDLHMSCKTKNFLKKYKIIVTLIFCLNFLASILLFVSNFSLAVLQKFVVLKKCITTQNQWNLVSTMIF